MIILPQVNNDMNKHFMGLVAQTFATYNVPFVSKSNNGMTIISIEGVGNVFKFALPLLGKYPHLFYHKYPALEMMIRIKRLIGSGVHLTEPGMTKIIQLCYGYPNFRQSTIEV